MNNRNIAKLEKLRQQHDKLKSRIQKMETVQKASEHKKDTRRKILIGSYFLDQALEHGTYEDIKTKMADFLTRNSDRVLFDLPELKEEMA